MSYDIRDHIGERTKVHHTFGAYRLPDGLPEGAEVVLEDFQPGYWFVRYNGERYRVGMSCVGDSGQLSKLKPHIHPGCKPRLRQPPPTGFERR